MTTNVNFDELAGKAFEPTATSDDYERLFAAVFSLEDWYFIADEKFEYKMPYCAIFPEVFGGETALAVFTDGERARKFIAESEMKPKTAHGENQNPNAPQTPDDLILRISTTGILDFFERLFPLGVTKIFFNPDTYSHGFHHDLKMMRPIYEHLQDKGLLSENEAISPENKAIADSSEEPFKESESDFDFDALAKKAMETNAMEDLNELFGAAFALEKWSFISRGELPNVYPYIASNPAAADNQPMIRAFTDTDRLLRFARENNLTETDGSAKMLTIPTENIVSYLEGFIAHGAHGVWFNSDSQSSDFFIPINQLQPIRDHLAKTKPAAAAIDEKNYTALLLTVSDGLTMPSGFVSKSTYNCNFFCWIPREWTEDLQLKNEYLEKLYMRFYGANWRAGNSDGSRYVVLESNSAVMSPERAQNTKWNVVKNTEFNQYWFYIGDGDGAFRNVTAEEFQTHFDAYFHEENQNESRENQDRLADFGMSETADGDFEQNLTINKIGAVDFDASIAPFYEAIVPLLKDFQGTGEYVTLLNFEPDGKSHAVENIAENAHGAYLQIRRFVYLNPKNGVRIGVNSIHSNRLRRVASNAELLVSFELCKNLDNQTAAFYHAFQGPKSDVLNLIAAIQPLLESVNYESVQ